jgi:hypothetical protein
MINMNKTKLIATASLTMALMTMIVPDQISTYASPTTEDEGWVEGDYEGNPEEPEEQAQEDWEDAGRPGEIDEDTDQDLCVLNPDLPECLDQDLCVLNPDLPECVPPIPCSEDGEPLPDGSCPSLPPPIKCGNTCGLYLTWMPVSH